MTSYLTGYVDTALPGFREVTVAGSPATVAVGVYHWPDFVAAVAATGALASMGADYRVALGGSASDAVVWGDRLGWLLGFDAEPGDAAPAGNASVAHRYSPCAIPLIGGIWEEVDLRREVVTRVDRWRRAHGYVWGAAEVWRLRLTMTREAFEALEQGWLYRGRVRLWSDASAGEWSGENPTGYIEGESMGLEGWRWRDPTTQRLVECTMLIARGAPGNAPSGPLQRAKFRGYPTVYALRIEGVRQVFTERECRRVDAASAPGVPSGYVEAVPALVVESGWTAGVKLDRQTGFAGGPYIDFTLGWDALGDAGLLTGLFRAPEGATFLQPGTDLDGDELAWPVDDTTDFFGVDYLHLGRECVEIDTLEPTQVNVATRGVAGWPHAHADSPSSASKVGTHPSVWKGRIVRLYEHAATPDGRLLDATWTEGDHSRLVWSGYIDAPPKASQAGITLQAMPLNILPTQPIGYDVGLEVATGISRSDLPIVVGPMDMVTVTIDWTELSYGEEQASGTFTVTGPAVDPDAALVVDSYGAWAERLRKEIAVVISTAGFDWTVALSPWAVLGSSHPERIQINKPGNFTPGANLQWSVTVTVSVAPGTCPWWRPGIYEASAGGESNGVIVNIDMGPDGTGLGWLPVRQVEGEGFADAAVPGAAIGVLEVGDATEIIRWSEKLDPPAGNGTLTMVRVVQRGIGHTKPLDAWQQGAKIQTMSGVRDLVSSAVLTLLQSSGTGLRGDYDTLGLGLGYGIPEEFIDVNSIAGAHPLNMVEGDLVTSGRASLQDLAGGWLALLGRCLSMTDGVLTLVSTVPARDPAAATITAADVLLEPFEPLETVEAPNEIRVDTAGHGDESRPSIVVRDLPRIQAEGLREWTLKVPGIDAHRAHDYAASLIRLGDGQQIVRLRVPPWLHFACGDSVSLQLEHPLIYDFATGARAPSAIDARVVEVETDLYGGSHRLTLLLSGLTGVLQYLCPTATVTAVSGTDVTLSSGEGQWFEVNDMVRVYNRGAEATQMETREVMAVAGDVVTLDSAPAWLTVGTRLTFPPHNDTTARQQTYAFVRPDTRWR